MSIEVAAKLRTGEIDEELRAAVRRIARTPQLLVACDYDGTLAPIVDDPTHAAPLPEAVAALRSLAAPPQTTVAGGSGRAPGHLAALARLPDQRPLRRVHGARVEVGVEDRSHAQVVA